MADEQKLTVRCMTWEMRQPMHGAGDLNLDEALVRIRRVDAGAGEYVAVRVVGEIAFDSEDEVQMFADAIKAIVREVLATETDA